MIGKLVRAVFGTKNGRELKRMGKVVRLINELEASMEALSDDALKAKSEEFKKRHEAGESLKDLLPEAFAAVREASRRSLGLRHFDVQMIGGITLHEGRIAEMRTGEGKTLMATLAVYLNAVSGRGVHIVTVNDYLASRDAEWMRPLYEALGLTTGVIQSMQDPASKHAAYQADITYGTNNEFGFDYLRDNMALAQEDKVQRPLNFAVIDEVDSILIDEARTPLIISGSAEDSSALYIKMNSLVPKLQLQTLVEDGAAEKGAAEEGVKGQPGDYVVDEKTRQVELTEAGHQLVEELLIKEGLLTENDSLYAATNLNLLHHVYSALRAHTLFQRDIEYIVQDHQVVLIDEHTGRTMAGRRLSEGLHQALEAKEGVSIQSESQTLASTTFQNFFRLYPVLSGMTGTADTEAFEFRQIYGLDVVVIPTNLPVMRQDSNDLVFLSVDEKYNAIIDDVKACQERGVPVLVGTASIDTSEVISARLKKAGIKHEVLNAKQHEREADIIAGAGQLARITVATNMAGRGTDIQLGKFEFKDLLAHWQKSGLAPASLSASEDVLFEQLADHWVEYFLDEKQQEKLKTASFNEKKAALLSFWKSMGLYSLPFKPVTTLAEMGGLHIIGTERHESRRIDNQLRGRSGRQGDPGVSRFYLSLEDSLMRIFASDRVRNFMQALGMEKGEAIEHRMVSNAIEKAQRKVEGRNFDIRKQLLEYDDVSNDQRQVIYNQRNELLESEDIRDVVNAIRADVVQEMVNGFIPPMSLEEQWDITGLEQHVEMELDLHLPVQQWLNKDDSLHEESLRAKISDSLQKAYDQKCERIGKVMADIEKQMMLQVLDMLWKEHLSNMDHLRQGIGLRAYAQKNPKQEFKRESFELFQDLLNNLKHEVVRVLARVEPVSEAQMAEMEQQRREALERQKMQLQHEQVSSLEGGDELGEGEPEHSPFVREGVKIGRNDPCHCGSGKKYKQCHGKLA